MKIPIYKIKNLEEDELIFWSSEPPSREELLLEEREIDITKINSYKFLDKTDKVFIKYELYDLLRKEGVKA